MVDRVRSSVAKQEALMRLMSTDPTLLGSLDDDLLASLTLAAPDDDADPLASAERSSSADAASSYASASASATRHTLIDPRLSFDVSQRATSTKAPPVRLFSAEDLVPPPPRAPKRVLLHAASAPAAVAAAAPADAGRGRANAVTHESARKPLVSLLDDKALAAFGDLKAASRPSPAKSRVIPAATAAQVQQAPLPPSVASPTRGKKKKKKPKANTRRLAQAPAPPEPMVLLSAEQLYEFGGAIVGDRRSSFDTVDRSTIESTRSSSHESCESDDSRSSVADVPASARPKAAPAAMDPRCFVPRDQWVPKNARRSCAVCERDFGVLRKRHSCRMCGEVICSRCSVFRAVNLSVVEGKCRICSCCSVSYRKKLEDIVSFAASVSDAEASRVSVSASRPELEPEESGGDAPTPTPTPTPTPPPSRVLLTESTLSLLKAADDCERLKAPPARFDSDLSTLLASDYALLRDYAVSSASLSLSDLSFSSSASSSSRSVEDELEAALRAKQLEREVTASRGRIEELEVEIAERESQQEQLSSAQQGELADARRLIRALQEQLAQQEASARAAAATRDTLCLSNLRQAESYSSGDDESRALKKKLQVLERQLQLAGINVAEVIPYEVAKAKVAEIARRLQEIGASELVLDDKQAQAAARREYYQLEQDMEKYNTALVMTDEYVEEQRRKDAQFEDENRAANARALRLLRSAIPVEIARLSEAQLRGLATPTGAAFPGDLAKRLKRTNVLQLLRADPKDIARMHPSVVEGYRTTGLTLLERRALHEVMLPPFREWKRQHMDDMSQRKFQWYTKLRDALESAVRSYAQHCAGDGDDASASAEPPVHSCKLLGLSCPVRAEAKVEALYAAGLGFPDSPEYAAQDVVKSDPDGAGEKALQEAQAYVREMVANQRQRALKAHYKLSMRQVAQAIGALEEIDALVERLKTLDAAVVALPSRGDDGSSDEPEKLQQVQQQRRQQQALNCESVLQAGRELVLLLARRAGICVVGKRNAENDELDSRSPLERQCAASAVAFLRLLLDDVRAFATEGESSASGSVLGSLRYVSELLEDVEQKNASGAASSPAETANGSSQEREAIAATTETKRVPWRERSSVPASSDDAPSKSLESDAPVSTPTQQPPAAGSAAVLPTSASLFDAIRARKQQKQSFSPPTTASDNAATSGSTGEEVAPVAAKPPLDLFAAIRARKAQLAADEDTADSTAAATRSA